MASCKDQRDRGATSEHGMNTDCETFGMIGRDARLLQILQTIRTAAPSDAPVLIEGESGSGKHLIAAAFHAHSLRSAGPFIRVNCAAIPHEQLEAVIEAANGGTLLLDELADMPSHLQMKFSSLREGDANFRLVVTTNYDTTGLLREGILREDLYFRISTIKIRVPALRERLDDIPLLSRHFLDRFNRQYNKKIRRLSKETLFRLLRYDWPGNIRELENAVVRAVAMCDGLIRAEDLPQSVRNYGVRSEAVVTEPTAKDDWVTLSVIEGRYVAQVLEHTRGNKQAAARVLAVDRKTLDRMIKRHHIDSHHLKALRAKSVSHS